MTFSDAEHIAGTCGVGQILHLGAGDTALTDELLQRGANTTIIGNLNEIADVLGTLSTVAAQGKVFDTVIVEAAWMLQCASFDAAFEALRKVADRWLVVRFGSYHGAIRKMLPIGERAIWENAALKAGFRRAPSSVSVSRYRGEYNDPLVPQFIEFERIPDEVCTKWPIEALLADRDLHMDMSRESGARADAHMVRYALAAELVRPGDTVLDCACGLGYGSAILAAQSRGGEFIGVDLDPETIAYARANFSQRYGIDYCTGSATDLSFIEDNSIDFLVSFETIEHLEDYSAFLDEAYRVLKPDGRLIASVPNLWVDETGHDPNPYHFHAFDYDKFRETISSRFIVEGRWAQEAPGGFKLWGSPRRLDKLPLDAPAHDTEWLILVASVDPLKKKAGTPYRHPEFGGQESGPLCWVVAFAEHYENPWLYRPMVQMGERIQDPAALADLAARALAEYPLESADFGAALTILAYAILDQRNAQQIDDALNLIQTYLGVDSTNPHIARWQISAAFAAGKLALAKGDRQTAADYFQAISQSDFLAFSPLIATKAIASSFMLGMMYLADGNEEDALRQFNAGVANGRKALHADDINAIGHPDYALPFGFKELGEVADMAAQCATAVKWLPLYKRSPGIFWKMVDTKRFGLASWALALQRENAVLRQNIS